MEEKKKILLIGYIQLNIKDEELIKKLSYKELKDILLERIKNFDVIIKE